jgi:hypothetical protein
MANVKVKREGRPFLLHAKEKTKEWQKQYFYDGYEHMLAMFKVTEKK